MVILALFLACSRGDTDTDAPAADLAVDAAHVAGSLDVQDVWFADDDCALAEACVGGSGWRRVARFSTTVANVGDAPIHVGAPSAEAGFLWSACHDHWHWDDFSAYRLLDPQGGVAALGHKQAFCLVDDAPAGDDAAPRLYTSCDLQGLSPGWKDTYYASLDCQWVDVTDVAPGTYGLEVAIDPLGLLPDDNAENDVAVVDLVLRDPADEPPVTDACPGEAFGPYRNCGWAPLSSGTCAPGATVAFACSACEGTSVVRICDGADCRGKDALANAEGCPSGAFVCPADGAWSALTGAWGTYTSGACGALTIP